MQDNQMTVREAIQTRKSVRDFLPRPIPFETIKSVLEAARRTPSGGNVQPWHAIVLSGSALDEFRTGMLPSVEAGIGSEPEQYAIYPPKLADPYAARRFKVGEDMYARAGIPRSDKAARLAWIARNFRFFDAPVGMFVHTPAFMGPPQWSDLGMWMQTIMLLLRSHGLDSCSQEAWSLFHSSVRRLIPIPDDHIIFAGMAIGYADPNAPVNELVSDRADTSEYIRYLGFDDEQTQKTN